MRMVIGVIVGISFAVLVLLGIIALVCWHKYNNTKEQDILKIRKITASIRIPTLL